MVIYYFIGYVLQGIAALSVRTYIIYLYSDILTLLVYACISVHLATYIPYVGKCWSGKKLANLANRGLFANILLANYFF